MGLAAIEPRGVPSLAVQVRLLGPLELTGQDGPIALSTPKLRTLLVVLAIQPNDVVSEVRLIDALWGETAPRTAAKTLQNHILRLRRVLQSGRSALLIQTAPGGYRLDVQPDELDIAVAERLVAEARAAGLQDDRQAAAACYRHAEALWRGPSLEGFAEEPFALGEAARLDELRRTAFEERVDAELALGRHTDLVGELEAAVTREPLRERRWGQLMLALYRSGRQADALRTYQRVRTMLGDELGLEPGGDLRSLEHAILIGDDALDLPPESVHVAPLPSAFVPTAGRPFIGRTRQLDRLQALLDEVGGSGVRRLVVIGGEPGIGKTRLAAKLAVDARADGAISLYGRSDEALDAPFQPFIEALEQLIAATDIVSLVASLGVRAAHLTRLLPSLQAHMSTPMDWGGDHAAERYELFDAIDAVLERISEPAPVVVVLDDLHWADSASLLLLRYLARSPRPAHVLILGTYRQTEVGRTHPLAECLADLRSSGRVESLLLHGLTEIDIRELLASERGELVSSDFIAALHQQTEGNPFFIEEVMRHLEESERTAADHGEEPAARLRDLPEGIRDVIGRRLSRLPPTVNEVLRVAAVIGPDFDLRTLVEVMKCGTDEVLEALDDAVAAEVVGEATGAFGVFAFTHALIRQTLYGELTATRRAQLHWRVGQAFAVTRPDDLYGRAAHLADGLLAGDPVTAVEACLAAGDHARGVLGFEQAAEQYQQVIAILDKSALDDADRRYSALEGLAAAHLSMAHQEPMRTAALEAADLARTHGWAERLADLACLFQFIDITRRDDGGIQLIDEALGAIGHRDDPKVARLLSMRSRLSSAVLDTLDVDAADAAVAMARRLGDPADVRFALSERALALVPSPRLDELLDAANDAIKAAASKRPTRAHAMATRALTLGCLRAGDRPSFEMALEDARAEFGLLHEELSLFLMQVLDVVVAIADGRFAEAEQLGRHIVDQFSSFPSAALVTTAQLGGVRLERGHHAEVIPAAERLLAEVPDQAYRTWLAVAYHDVGRTEDARRIFDQFADNDWAAVPNAWMRALPLRNLAELCARFGDPDRAGSLRPLVEPWAGQLWIAGWATSLECAADRALGQLDTALGDFDRAADEYEAALKLERRFGAAALVPRTQYWYARMLRGRGRARDRAKADRILDEALETTKRLEMAMLHHQCEELRTSVT